MDHNDNIDPVEDFDHTPESFDAWFHANEDKCHEMLRSDAYELLYAAWFGGYNYGIKAMGDLLRPGLTTGIGIAEKLDEATDDAVD